MYVLNIYIMNGMDGSDSAVTDLIPFPSHLWSMCHGSNSRWISGCCQIMPSIIEAVLDCFIERLIGHHMTRVTYSSWVAAMACRSCIDERAVEVRLLEPTLAHTTVNQRQHQIVVRSVSLLYMMTSFTGYVLTHSIWACALVNHCCARYHDDVMRWHIVHVLWTRGRRNTTYIHTYIRRYSEFAM